MPNIYAILFSLLVSFGLSLSTQASWTDIHWKVLKSDRVDVIYDAKHQELAEHYLREAVTAMKLVEGSFTYHTDKLLLVLMDNTDQTNGYVTPLPYSHMVLFPVLPSAQSSIGEYGNWERELILHEYTHVITIEARRDLVKALYYGFGTLMTPNLLLPRWWLEGIAVEMETRLSNHGRLRSPSQDAGARALAYAEKLRSVDIAEINESSIPSWPFGSRPYFYGSYLWSEMLSQKSVSLADELTQKHAGRIPYFINTPISDLTQKSYDFFFEEAKFDLQERSEKQFDQLLSEKPTNPIVVKKLSGEALAPAISPDGRYLAFVRIGKNFKRSLQILYRPNTQVPFNGEFSIKGDESDKNETSDEKIPIPRITLGHDAPPGGTISQINWFHQSAKLIYDKVDTISRFENRSDLHTYDINTKKSEALTQNARLREPSLSPDDQWVAAIQLGAGRTDLVIYDLNKKTVNLLLKGALGERLSNPVFLNANEILFSHRFQGVERFKILNLGNKVTRDFLPEFTSVKAAQVIPEKALLFSSAQNGVYNIYHYDFQTQKTRPLTNSLTAEDAASMDPIDQTLYVSHMTGNGLVLGRLPQDQQYQKTGLPKVGKLLADRYPAQKEVATQTQTETQVPFSVEDYSSLTKLWPHYWLPFFSTDKNGTYFSFTTGGQDPLSKNVYALSAAYDSKINRGSFNAQYLNNFFEPQLLFSASRFESSYIGSSVRRITTDYAALAAYEIRSVSEDLSLLLGGSWTNVEQNSFSREQHGPTLAVQYDNTAMSPTLAAIESGSRFYSSLSNFQSSDELAKFNKFYLSYAHYWRKWLPEDHVIYFNAQYANIEKDVSVNYYNDSSLLQAYLAPRNSLILMRGYLNSQFLMKDYGALNLEYRLPIASVYSGTSTWPYFLKKMHLYFVWDGLQGEGYFYNTKQLGYLRTDNNKLYSSYGAELKMDYTLGYHLPISLIVGAYAPANSEVSQDGQFVITIRM